MPTINKRADKPKKYFALAIQSMFTVWWKNSIPTPLLVIRHRAVRVCSQTASASDAELRLARHLRQVPLENHARHIHRRKQVCQQTDGQRHGEPAHRTGSEQEEKDC